MAIEKVERKGVLRISKKTGKPYRSYYHKKHPAAESVHWSIKARRIVVKLQNWITRLLDKVLRKLLKRTIIEPDDY